MSAGAQLASHINFPLQHLKVKLGVDEIEQKDINSRIALCMTALGQKLLLF